MMLKVTTIFVVFFCIIDTNANIGISSFQRAGVRGVKGDKGEPGPPGPPGVCICESDKKSKSDIKKESEYKAKGDISSKLDAEGDAGLKTESQVKSDGYFDAELSQGASLNKNGVGLNKKYNKGNFKESNGVNAFENVAEFERTEIREDDGLESEFEVDFSEDISKRFKESSGNEGHSGKYKGSEFDISNRLRDKEGNMVERSVDKDIKQSQYGNIEANGNANIEGKFNDELFERYGDDEKDLYAKKTVRTGYGPGYGGDYKDNYVDSPAGDKGLYGRYKGTDKGIENGNGKFGFDPKYGDGYGRSKKREKIDSSKDGKIEMFGNNFNERLKFDEGKKVATEQGSRIKANERGTFNREKFRDIDNKGHNKLATYQGDYNKRDKFHNLDQKADVDISLEQTDTFDGGFVDGRFVADDGFDFSITEKSKVSGKKVQSGYDAYNKFDDLKEKEYLLKNDAKVYNDKYKSLDKSKDTKVKKEDDIYFKASKDNKRGKKKEFESKKDNSRSRPRNYYRQNNDYNDNKYVPPRQRGPYRGRSLLGINDDNIEILSLKNDIKRLYFGMIFIGILFVCQTIYIVMSNKQYN